MKYIVFTSDGHGLPIAYRLQQEGNEVEVGVVEDKSILISSIERPEPEHDETRKKRLKLYDNLLKKTPADTLIEKLKKVKKPEEYFVFFDLNNLFRYADQIRDMGFHGNFPTEDDVLLEIDRARAKQFASEQYSQLHVATTKDFQKARDAISFLESTDDIWVLKGKDDSARTVVPETSDAKLANAQLIEILTTAPETYEKSGFILELLISQVVELTPEKIYYNGEPVATTVDIENKPLGSGNIGPQTGCAADLIFPTDLEDKINQVAFPAFVDELAKQHKGLFYWDASILVDGKTGKMYFGEYCSNRPGYNALFSEIALAGSATKYFESIVKGKNPFKPGQVSASVRLFNLRDNDSGEITSNKQINIAESAAQNIWLWDVYRNETKLCSTGFDRNLAVVTGVGNSVDEAVTRLYKNVDGLAFESAYYRPRFDFISRDYSSAILNRLNYGLHKNLYKIGFAM